ncbi:MAG: hypothetical protein AAGC68_01940, partial [Verrucomicrobiota bacterium]
LHSCGQDQRSALVTQTLLVAVRLHALATLVIIDFGFPLLFEGSHNQKFLGSASVPDVPG